MKVKVNDCRNSNCKYYAKCTFTTHDYRWWDDRHCVLTHAYGYCELLKCRCSDVTRKECEQAKYDIQEAEDLAMQAEYASQAEAEAQAEAEQGGEW